MKSSSGLNLHSRPTLSGHRSAFTLIELLVVIAIILVLASVTLATVNYSINADRVRAGARQVQSFLAGARDKAIYANEIRGVRFLLDPNDNHAVSAMQYIGAPVRETGFLTFNPSTSVNPNLSVVTGDITGRTVAQITGGGNSTPWSSLIRRGLLLPGVRIQIPQGTGAWYTVSGYSIPTGYSYPILTLDRPCADLAGSGNQVSYTLQLAAVPMSDSQPVQLPRGVVIDLDGSLVPPSWRPVTLGTSALTLKSSYFPQMDILFSPRGTAVGNASTADLARLGMVHLLLADASDLVKWKASTTTGVTNRSTNYNTAALPVVPAENGSASPPLLFKDRIIVTLTTRTGNVAVYPLNVPAANTSPWPTVLPDPFYFAETGQVANK